MSWSSYPGRREHASTDRVGLISPANRSVPAGHRLVRAMGGEIVAMFRDAGVITAEHPIHSARSTAEGGEDRFVRRTASITEMCLILRSP